MERQPPDRFLLEDFLPYQLSVAANRISRIFARRYAEEFGLTIPEWRVMAVLGRFGTISPGAIVEHTEMDKVKVSRAAAAMTKSGLIAQSPNPADGRAHLLSLTPKGQATHTAIIPRARALESELAACLAAPDLATLKSSLRRVTAHALVLGEPEK
jgi:DNA-binding MarR family transcriptional regulator